MPTVPVPEEVGAVAKDPNKIPKPEGSDDLPKGHPLFRGPGGAFVNWVNRIPPCVWVLNTSKDNIVVRVCKKDPSHFLKAINITAGSTGGGGGVEFSVGSSQSVHPTLLDESW
jgi:hypothetical protein